MEPKPGIKTTEFWLGLAAIVLVNVGAVYSGHHLAQLGAALGSAIIAAGYTFGRTQAKNVTSGLLIICGLTCLPGCWLLQQTDTTSAIEALAEMNAEFAGRGEAIDALVTAAGTSIDPGVKTQIMTANASAGKSFENFSKRLQMLLEEYGRVDWSSIMQEGFSVYAANKRGQ